MNRYIKDQQKLSLLSPDSKKFYLYFFMPLLLGILLGDGIGIDISQVAAKYIGLLRFIESAGIDIRTKSMILVLYFVFAPCYWHSVFKHRKSPDKLKEKTVADILVLIVLSLVMLLVGYLVVIVGLPKDSLITPSRPIRFLLFCARWDVSFAVYVGFAIWLMTLTLCLPVVLVNELLQRLKNRSGHLEEGK